ncbi:CAMK family protein kinase [Trichomonas vaginalis G3]|uniref:CAMK family protein kinase n=1 Tax=Trichomonas vaginalis (strain ATCC PRA-98 / G3) TaxID=412133 RepID=A2FKS0_TRIV3|nr:CAMK family protein kinase [Trichomonas vaginalis G3]|eukprot:XP_001307424.1 CAMK family protein kinase [Trichomonas vaginalis G3]
MSSSNSPRSIRSFFSFASFILQTENPQIFEWLFKKEIGKGSLSRVFLAENTETHEMAAAKVYNKSMLFRQTLGGEEAPYVAVQREIEILASISHRYVLPIIEVIEDDYSNSLILMMPYAEKGSLQSYLNSIQYNEEIVAIAFHQIAEALRYVHSRNIVHRDIKPENILVFSDTFFCLSDFSVSTTLESPNQKLIDTRGSPAFLSPEECGGDPFLPKPADVWAFGVSLYSIIFKKLPFDLDQAQGKTVANTIFAVTELLANNNLQIPEGTGASPEVIDLITKILNKDPTERPTFADIVQHPWFNSARDIDETNMISQTLAEEEDEQEAQKLTNEENRKGLSGNFNVDAKS